MEWEAWNGWGEMCENKSDGWLLFVKKLIKSLDFEFKLS